MSCRALFAASLYALSVATTSLWHTKWGFFLGGMLVGFALCLTWREATNA